MRADIEEHKRTLELRGGVVYHAYGLLMSLLDQGHIPDVHKSSVEKIRAQYDEHTARLDEIETQWGPLDGQCIF